MRLRLALPFAALVLALAALSGCATYRGFQGDASGLAERKKFFVQTNLNDNRGLGTMIVLALRARGYEVESGPLTLLPEDSPAVVSFSDRWGWDFKEHLTVLELEVHDSRTGKALGSAFFRGPMSLTTSTQAIVARTVDELLRPKRGQRPAPQPPAS